MTKFSVYLVDPGSRLSTSSEISGAQKRKGDYFGPFASVWAVDEALSILQKGFSTAVLHRFNL